ncbi:hypothetical protein NE237_010864 [Protea cynaroides]|uniref:Bifunctional inhibitor/plant lipid transfer protein/seed storage helical domain-containing protein n=1 Tax=Protea cynaroides TaxID=273540 RepID=A0A9Q0R1Z5_9MAGN|nr:hypothetical protein NE237_010864 [Protea cynaroides]
MAITRITFSGIMVVFFVAFFTSVPITSAQGPAMSPGGSTPLSPSATAATPSGDCTTALLNTSDCLTYVEAGSNLTKPDKGCCGELAGLVDSNPICLCQLLSHSSAFGVQIDENRALGLPKVCRVSTPSVSLCAEVGIPIGAPAASEESGASSSPEGLTGGPVIAPSTTKNGASSIMTGFNLVFLTGLSILALPFFL